MNKKDKDIYELLNEVEFDITEETEIPMDDIKKRRIKNIVKDKIRREVWWKKKSFIAIAASIALIITLISPVGQRAIAEIEERFFFNPGLGIVNVNEEMYVLMEPIMLETNEKYILVKSITSDIGGISIELWVNDESLNGLSKEEVLNKEEILNKKVDVNEIIKVITPDGNELTTESYSIGGGGRNTFIGAYFEGNEMLNEITLKVYDLEFKNIKLEKVSEIENFENIGFNDEDNGLIIGGNRYVFNGETYISLWTDEQFKDTGAYGFFFDRNNIIAKSKSGEVYEVNPSDYSGSGREFVIEGEIKEPISLSIDKVEVSYNLKNSIDINIKIPDKGEEIEINKEIYIEDLDEKAILKSIKNTGKEIELYFDTGTLRKERSDIFMIGAFGRSSYGIGASPEDKTITLGIYDEDLTIVEKLINKVNIKISRVDIIKYGSWNFTIE